ncbi:hypothetical protein H2199_004066 [Coniosporium tulheliwenetii]|uniref:Uncharacterized protein n=1 Tax=Coniosporium tulheliwenetii TaxID=3383036 RepID=A0ACC2Z7Y5_9PEZI|nr:hypothetical protein H2199_004066 [Cladosporium sp. JES 115]
MSAARVSARTRTQKGRKSVKGVRITFSSAIPVTPETSNVELETRAPVGHSCAGNNNGVYGCVTATFKDRYNLDIDLSVKDTKGDSHPVYVWIRVYDDRGNTDLAKLPNHSGVGKTVSQKQTWKNTRGRITGFRAKACNDEDDGGSKSIGDRDNSKSWGTVKDARAEENDDEDHGRRQRIAEGNDWSGAATVNEVRKIAQVTKSGHDGGNDNSQEQRWKSFSRALDDGEITRTVETEKGLGVTVQVEKDDENHIDCVGSGENDNDYLGTTASGIVQAIKTK